MIRLHRLLLLSLIPIIFPISAFAAAEKPHVASTVLKATVAESVEQIVAAQNRALGFIAKDDPGGKTATVSRVIMGTPAWYQGVREGDKILSRSLSEQPGGLNGKLVLVRAGQTFQAALTAYGDYRRFLNAPQDEAAARPTNKAAAIAVVAAHSAQQTNAALAEQRSAGVAPALENPQEAPSTSAETFGLNAQQTATVRATKLLKGRDLVVLIDRSGSMSTTDCPQAMSRWDWCKMQTMQLSQDVSQVFPRGFTLVLFNNHTLVTENADVNAIASAFQNNKPDGGTDTAGALTQQLKAFGQRKNEAATKPLVLVVITDGAPNDENKLRNTLVAAANDATNADDISVVFVEVGEDNQATADLEDLERNLNQEGAKFNIVHSVLFDRVIQRGLLRSVAEVVANH
ncbi:MAG TPA: VWA domain-containing protein [Candidatus Obscuribacterales bacterium]